MRHDFEALLDKALRSRNYTAWYTAQAENQAAQHEAYRTTFGRSFLAKALALTDDWRDQAKVRVDAQKAQAKERRKQALEHERLQHIEIMADLAKWKEGEIVSRSFYNTPIALRLSSNGESIETSRGAEVPVAHARRIWKLVQGIRSTGQTYTRNGHTEHVGAFKVDSIDYRGTLVAGCHVIEFAAMAELAARLNWPVYDPAQTELQVTA
jgi:hypothetical protein